MALTGPPTSVIAVPRPLLVALRRAQARATSPFVIAYAHGDGGRVGSVKKDFNSAAERAGIPDCTSHTLRHTAGTWMAQRGVPLYEVAGYLGHSEKRTTELYAHHHFGPHDAGAGCDGVTSRRYAPIPRLRVLAGALSQLSH